jgi:hypothetical protein
MSQFTEAVRQELAGLTFVSPGACPGCATCEANVRRDGLTDEEWSDLAGGPSFSWSRCQSCGSTFGGDRHAGHATDPALGGLLLHLEMCSDCVVWHANGEEPETWSQHPARYQVGEHPLTGIVR